MGVTRFSGLSIKGGNSYSSLSAGYPAIMAAPTATDGGTGTTASIAFTAQTGATSYTALSSPGSFTGTGSSSPVTVSGLTAGTAYTFQIRANNSVGSGPYSAASNSVTPVQPTAFESIATATGTGSSGTITFSSIPSTFKHLQIRGIARTTDTVGDRDIIIRFNSDTGANYAYHSLQGTGSAAAAFGGASSTQTFMGNAVNNSRTSGIVAPTIIDILDYASTTKNKTLRGFNGVDANGSGNIYVSSSLWLNTSAITTIAVVVGAGNWTTDTTFALYGIKEA